MYYLCSLINKSLIRNLLIRLLESIEFNISDFIYILDCFFESIKQKCFNLREVLLFTYKSL